MSAIAYDVRCASRLVAAVFDLPSESFLGERKGPPPEIHARQVVCYLLCTDGGFDQIAVARALGRHRSTVGHAIGLITGLREHPEFDEALTKLGAMYRELREAHGRVPALVEELAP